MVYGPTASQPKGVAVSGDGHVFVAEAGHVEALRSGQRVCAVDAGYGAISVAVGTGIVAVGGEVRCPIQRRWSVGCDDVGHHTHTSLMVPTLAPACDPNGTCALTLWCRTQRCTCIAGTLMGLSRRLDCLRARTRAPSALLRFPLMETCWPLEM